MHQKTFSPQIEWLLFLVPMKFLFEVRRVFSQHWIEQKLSYPPRTDSILKPYNGAGSLPMDVPGLKVMIPSHSIQSRDLIYCLTSFGCWWLI